MVNTSTSKTSQQTAPKTTGGFQQNLYISDPSNASSTHSWLSKEEMALMRSGEVKPQLFSLKTAMPATGMINNFVSVTDLMKVSIKIYAEGGENFLHTHTAEDHFFVILEGEATFHGPNGDDVTLSENQGIMLPRGCYYSFTATGKGHLVLLRVAATYVRPWVNDSRLWWQGIKDTRDVHKVGENALPGVFFAKDSILSSQHDKMQGSKSKSETANYASDPEKATEFPMSENEKALMQGGKTKPQLFSLKTPLPATGMINNFVSVTDLMKVSIKIYAEGGENFLHTHTAEDHFFVILEGEATFHDSNGNHATLHQHQGIMLPRGCYYNFTATGEGHLVLLRVAATYVQPWVKDSRLWWQGIKDTRAVHKVGENALPGEFFAAESELSTMSRTASECLPDY